jgi:3-deoxy-D-manno-octulosonate 8-phosphate phosphatase (KDO 8-P phosphatase)
MIIKQELLKRAKKIKYIVTDVDGVLTDGSLWVAGDRSEPLGKFNILDGFAIKDMLPYAGIEIIVISGRKSFVTEARCLNLGIAHIHTGIADKQSKLIEIATQFGINLKEEAVYIGDDVIDLKAMALVALSIAPKNAVASVLERVDLVTNKDGGCGVIREVTEMIFSAQGILDDFLAKYI